MSISSSFKLYLVTQRGTLAINEFLHIILEAVQGGVSMVQLREKQTSTEEFIHVGKRVHHLLRPLGIPLIINDRLDVAAKIQAEGVHLGQQDGSATEARKRLGPHTIIGLSVENMQQAQEAIHEPVNYLAASPVFSTDTKPDCGSPWGLIGLKELCLLTAIPIIAIGGIHIKNIRSIQSAGASGAAVVSAIFDSPSPKQAAQQLLKEISK